MSEGLTARHLFNGIWEANSDGDTHDVEHYAKRLLNMHEAELTSAKAENKRLKEENEKLKKRLVKARMDSSNYEAQIKWNEF